ncbi:N-acetylgalactosaminyltransferase 6-like [Bolinopsis microptera]|uniref:N-acetylgalactosaminyltransferase 6-like n=1 Tax=Bolinopsis microptera TaxID=2820187 RepID=UPI003079644C
MKLQDRILYGSNLKRAAQNIFNKREGYNESFLDSLPIMRGISRDFRPIICQNSTTYSSKSKVSVIINYHNELLSLLLRSVYSVLASISPHNLHELILIDDGSDLTAYKYAICKTTTLKYKTRRWYKTQHFTNISHNLQDLTEVESLALGFDRYMNWMFIYQESPKDGRNFRSPAIMGGAFVVKKKFLEEIDYFGMCMEGWGQENIELSLKTWFCGGEVLFVTCSRVLHFAANRTPSRHGDRIKPAEFWHNQGIVVKSYFPSDIYEEFDRVHNIDKDLERYVINQL